jgi:precorrin-3B C17-methyltransferase
MRSRSNPSQQQGNDDRVQTEKPKCNRGYCTKTLYIVGIGPGSLEQMSKRAKDILISCDTIVGYTKYIELIRPLVEGKTVISTGMTQEVHRVEQAIQTAMAGKSCAIVSSGDPGIYAMAGLVFEMCLNKGIHLVQKKNVRETELERTLVIEVAPGIPALSSGAALLGAPLMHDFAVISLSDLLTPWEVIEKRLEAAAMADFVIVIYNPKSKKRHWQLEKAQQIILKHRSGDTPVGLTSNIMRDGESVEIIKLKNLHIASVNMLTTVFVGNSHTAAHQGFMVTPRGYANKYQL